MLFATMLGAVVFAEAAAALPFDEYDYRVVADYDFDELSNPSGQVKDCSGMLVDGLACFSGEILRMPTNSTGIVQISVSSRIGFLEYNGKYAAPENVLHVRARKPKEKPGKWLFFADAISNGITNNLGTVSIGMDFEWYSFPLDSLNGGETISLHQDTSLSTERIILIDRIIFARKRNHGFYLIIR